MQLALALLVAATPATPIKGMTVSCPMYGQTWGSSAMKTALADLATLGVDSVAIHPYARIGRNGSISYSEPNNTAYLVKAIQIAKGQKIDLFWKPHLAYWGAFKWRGSIAFDDETKWRRFFADHTRWIVAHAKLAETAGLPLLAIGVELDATTHREADWRRMIAAVRKVYRGKLTFASNWDSYERIRFWDALDYIGVQAYFPLGGEGTQPKKTLEASWDRHLSSLKAASKKWSKPVLFTEIGYNRSSSAASKPWDASVDDSRESRALRRLLMEVALDKTKAAPFIHGMWWWKWIPGWAPWERDFAMQDDEARAVLRSRWTSGS